MDSSDIIQLLTAKLLQMLLVQTLLVRRHRRATALHRVRSTEEQRVWTVRMTTIKVKQEAKKELYNSWSEKMKVTQINTSKIYETQPI